MISSNESVRIKNDYTVVFVAPFYDRSGYGVGARAYARMLWESGLRVRIHPIGIREPGIDDEDLHFFSVLEETPLQGRVVLLIYHVASPVWLNIVLPPDSIRAIITTHEVAWQKMRPKKELIDVCNAMDLVFLAREEIPHWKSAGLDRPIVNEIRIPHPWMFNRATPEKNSSLSSSSNKKFRLLTIAMFMPRRRWDSLIAAFLAEFQRDEDAELVIKTNYPSWHPVQDKPKADLFALVDACRTRIPSKANIIIDDQLGTRREVMGLIDSANVVISTDLCPTAGVGEALLRGKPVIVPESFSILPPELLPRDRVVFIDETDSAVVEIDESFRLYTPSYPGSTIRKIPEAAIRLALRVARNRSESNDFGTSSIWLDQQRKLYSADALLTGIHDVESRRRASISVHWEGSFSPMGSLAKVNRCITGNIRDESFRLTATLPDEEYAQIDFASVTPTILRFRPSADITVRHQWPPDFSAPESGRLVYIQPWEFGGLPQHWVESFNRLADEIWVPSEWVRDCYVNSGVDPERVLVIPNGVDPRTFTPEGSPFQLKTKKQFKFLYIGGEIYRKGIDLLIKAYDSVFSADDDVALIIKGGQYKFYKNSLLAEALSTRTKRQPEIEFIDSDLSEDEIASLYRACDVTVIPFRGEGFCLPLLESLACSTPVIATDGGGPSEFLTPDFADLIPAVETDVASDFGDNAGVGSSCADGYWLLEPDLVALCDALRKAVSDASRLRARGCQGRDHVIARFTWAHAAGRVCERLKVLCERPPFRFRELPTVILAGATSEDMILELVLSFASAFSCDSSVELVLNIPDDEILLSTLERARLSVDKMLHKEAHRRIRCADFNDVLGNALPRHAILTLNGKQRAAAVFQENILKRLNRFRRIYRHANRQTRSQNIN